MPYGPRDTNHLVMLTGWDATALKNFQLLDGTTFAAVVAQTNAALGALNAELYSDPLWSSLVSYTDQPDLEYRIGASNGFERFTEYGRADPKRADTDGHMLPLAPYDRMLAWTWNYLRQARMSQIQADLADAIKDARDLWRVRILTRLLKRGDDSGAAIGLGSGGLSAGFATAAANTGVDYIPPAYGGNSFTVSHEHYVAVTGGMALAVFQAAKNELREHGHEPTYEFLASKSDETTIRAISGFVPTASNLVTYGSNQSLANMVNAAEGQAGSYYIGTLEDFAIRIVPGIPQYYGVGYKSYGPNSQRNPLRIRLQKGMTRPQVVAMPDPRAGTGAYPLQNLMLFTEFGVGVADRTAGTARYTNNASWSDGTPT